MAMSSSCALHITSFAQVEVWDVVDKGRKKKPLEGLKLQGTGTLELAEEPALDAEFLDVYKGTHGVIMCYDMTKQV